jgi:signal transduction histidine kinase
MEHNDKQRAKGHHRNVEDDEIDRAFGELRVPLSVMYGYSQLLQRRINQGRIHEAYACLDGLAAIQRSARVMEANLMRIEAMARARQSAQEES